MTRVHLKRNAPVAQLYEDAIRNEGAIISNAGALINFRFVFLPFYPINPSSPTMMLTYL